MKRMQENGQHESIHCLTSILLQDQDVENDRLASGNCKKIDDVLIVTYSNISR